MNEMPILCMISPSGKGGEVRKFVLLVNVASINTKLKEKSK